MSANILAVDDSPTMRALLSRSLESMGYRVTSAVDGQDALDKYAGAAPNAVITDINMPVLDGFGLIAALREREDAREVPILVLSTESAPEKKALARDAGATGWIVKPFDPESLNRALRRIIQ